MTGIMARARHYLSHKSLTTLYYTMIYLYLIYCNITWTSTYPTRLQPIFIIQKKIVRIMTFSKYREETSQIFRSLNIMNIYELNKYLIALFMYSYFGDKLPTTFNNYSA